jgi:hypothetical protein
MKKILYLSLLAHHGVAFAYLDPGTGSMIIQSLVAGIAAGFYFISMYFSKIKMFIFEKFNKNKRK